MSDKERILLCLVQEIFLRSLYDSESVKKWRDAQPGIISNKNQIQPGDLVVALTTIDPNEFMVGFVEYVGPDRVVIREIGGDRLCNYYNERFCRIDKKILGYEILEGNEYVIYKKVLKAFSRSASSNYISFKSISFNGDICTVIANNRGFPDKKMFEISFKYGKKTTIKEITEMLNNAMRKEDQEKIDK